MKNRKTFATAFIKIYDLGGISIQPCKNIATALEIADFIAGSPYNHTEGTVLEIKNAKGETVKTYFL